jgi:glycosyltransferase involved in cell wall biosynthesis
MRVLTVAWTAWTVMLAIPVAVFAIEVMAAVFLRSRHALPASSPSIVRNVLLVPAHNEESGIAATMERLCEALQPSDAILVVADNCTDGTAQAARTAGATVIERSDDAQRGKGYALDFGIRHLGANPPDVVTVIDADCRIDAQSLADLMHAPTELGLRGRIAEFAWRVKNHARPLGLARLGLPCHLTGTGMAFPWAVVARAQLASGHIAEDLQLGVDLAATGTPPLFVPDATVHSQFAANAEGAASQRTRWEHGHLHLLTTQAPRLVWTALRRADSRLLALSLDLLVPPLALLVLVVALNIAISAIFVLALDAPVAPLWIALASLGLLALSVLVAWKGFGRDLLSASDLLAAPGYALRKIPVYFKFLRARQKGWVRAERDGQRHD